MYNVHAALKYKGCTANATWVSVFQYNDYLKFIKFDEYFIPREKIRLLSDFVLKTRQIYNRVKTIKVFLLKVQILLFLLLRTTWKNSKSYFFSFWVI